MSQHTREIRRELLAEFLGTFVLIVFGVGVVAQFVLSRGTAGSYLAINLIWGLGVTMGCYVAGGISGAHLNPAVTIALAVHRGFPWRKVLPYTLAQLAGAFAASAVVYLTYVEALGQFDGGVRQVLGPQGTAGIWATYPQPFLSTLPGGLVDQVVGTALLMAVICALTDTRNNPPGAGLASARCRAARRRHRGGVRLQLRVCHQSGARLRAAPVHGAGRLGDGGLPGGQRLVVGARGRASCGGRARGMALRRLHRWAVSAQPGHRRGAESGPIRPIKPDTYRNETLYKVVLYKTTKRLYT